MSLDAETWRRRERALWVGVLLWATIVTAVATLAGRSVAGWLLATPPLGISGTILLSVALCAAFVEFWWRLIAEWIAADGTEDGLTEVPWGDE